MIINYLITSRNAIQDQEYIKQYKAVFRSDFYNTEWARFNGWLEYYRVWLEFICIEFRNPTTIQYGWFKEGRLESYVNSGPLMYYYYYYSLEQRMVLPKVLLMVLPVVLPMKILYILQCRLFRGIKNTPVIVHFK